MVRLKDNDPEWPMEVLVFQFHMVRLKVAERVEVRPGNPFQFHMVRLKVDFLSSPALACVISIPHGTIKRRQSQREEQVE